MILTCHEISDVALSHQKPWSMLLIIGHGRTSSLADSKSVLELRAFNMKSADPLSGEEDVDEENESGEGSSDDDDEVEKSVKAKFDELMEDCDASRAESWFVNEDAERRFEARYGDCLKRTSDQQQTLMHRIAQEATDSKLERYKPLISRLIKRHPELLEQHNRSQCTPLHTAISEKRKKLVLFICRQSPTNLHHAIAQPYLNSGNCLHNAISRGLKPDFVRSLIEYAGTEALRSQDGQGRTPLHLAVEYDRCTNSQFHVVGDLIQKCEEALDTLTNEPQCFSPFRLHKHTGTAHERQQETLRDFTRGKGNATAGSSLYSSRQKDVMAEGRNSKKDVVEERYPIEPKPAKAGTGVANADRRPGE